MGLEVKFLITSLNRYYDKTGEKGGVGLSFLFFTVVLYWLCFWVLSLFYYLVYQSNFYQFLEIGKIPKRKQTKKINE